MRDCGGKEYEGFWDYQDRFCLGNRGLGSDI